MKQSNTSAKTKKKTTQSTKKNVKSTTKSKSMQTKRKKNDGNQTVARLKRTRSKAAIIAIAALAVLLIFSTYAWFSVNLNVRVKTFNMIVTKNNGLTISFDGINFDTSVEISKDALIRELRTLYPNNTSHWSSNGLTPVSSNGIPNRNSSTFDLYASEGGVRYLHKNRQNGFINTSLLSDDGVKEFSYYIAFDLFFKNDSGSPIADNLYLDNGTAITLDEESTEEMEGLINSVRVGFVKLGSVPIDADVSTIQNIRCNNDCESIIYEPNSTNHTNLSIERASKYGVNLQNGVRYPTYGCIRAGGPIYISNTVSGSPNLDYNYFALQSTIVEDDFGKPLFTVPDGITKVRVYLWVEGQDIDSLETDSEGASMSVSINFVKDTSGYAP